MKQRKMLGSAALLWVAVLSIGMSVLSCSDDDPKSPSKEIVRVDIYKAENGTFRLQTQYNLTYDGRNRITDVRTDNLSQEISYTYGTGSVSYRWEGYDTVGGVFISRFEAELRSGRVQVGSVVRSQGVSSETFNYTYYYNNKGYIIDATFGASQSFNYTWGNKSLVVEGKPSGYDSEYGYSKTLNEYSIDLNVLPMLVDSRPNVLMVMNAYAHLAGVLGTRYPYFLEDVDYTYNYQYDADGRLVQISQAPATLTPDKQDTYWFMFTYGE